MLPLKLQDALSRVTSADEAYFLWSMCSDKLEGYNLILSRPGVSQVGSGARTRFGKSGFLASLFCHDNLFFINNEIRQEIALDQNSLFGVGIDIVFDANAASYLASAFEGSKSGNIPDFLEMIHHFKGNKINWNSAFYQIENSEAFLRGERLSDLFRVAHAAEKWHDMDQDYFVQTGELRARLPDEAYFKPSNEYLANWHQSLRHGALEQFRWQFDLAYALLLQMAILQLQWPSPKHAYKKTKAYLHLMHHEWRTIFLRIFVVALELFTRPAGSFAFFKPIQPGSTHLLEKLRGMAWDLRHFQFLEQVMLIRSGKERFLIPYFLTFDKGLSELWDLYPVRSCLVHDTDGHPICFPKRDIGQELETIFPGKMSELGEYFSFEAAKKRKTSKPDIGELPGIIAELEKKLFAVINSLSG